MFVVASKGPVAEMKERLDPGGFEATHGAAPYQGDDCAPPDRLLVWGCTTPRVLWIHLLEDKKNYQDSFFYVARDLLIL